MPDTTSQLSALLQRARELRITEGFALFILVKCPGIPEYQLINTSDPAAFRLWFEKGKYQFACIIDHLDILLIDSTLPIAELNQLFTDCEALKPTDRTCLALTDFLDLLKERHLASPQAISN